MCRRGKVQDQADPLGEGREGALNREREVFWYGKAVESD